MFINGSFCVLQVAAVFYVDEVLGKKTATVNQRKLAINDQAPDAAPDAELAAVESELVVNRTFFIEETIPAAGSLVTLEFDAPALPSEALSLPPIKEELLASSASPHFSSSPQSTARSLPSHPSAFPAGSSTSHLPSTPTSVLVPPFTFPAQFLSLAVVQAIRTTGLRVVADILGAAGSGADAAVTQDRAVKSTGVGSATEVSDTAVPALRDNRAHGAFISADDDR